MKSLVIVAGALLALALACATLGASPAPLAVGVLAPAFTLLDQAGEARALQELRGKPTVVFFYPKDGTPGCTQEACAFRDAWNQYEQAGVAVVGISTDDVAAHAAFAKEHGLQFPLLSDPDGQVARAWGVDVRFGMASRVSYLLNDRGVVARVFPDVDPGVHAREVLEAAAALALSTPAGG